MMHTQSQPFQIGTNTPSQQIILDRNDDSQSGMTACSCDSVLSRIIYGVKHYQRITQSLNLSSPLAAGSSTLGGDPSVGFAHLGTGPLGFNAFNGVTFAQSLMNITQQHQT